MHGELQFAGYGREAAEALLRWAVSVGAAACGSASCVANEPALAFWRRLGWTEVDRCERDSPQGRQAVVVLERATPRDG